MRRKPISAPQLFVKLHLELTSCGDEEEAYFLRVRVSPSRWKLSPWGDRGGGFWVVAQDGPRVLWWNDLENGWNVSVAERPGVIPASEYWCNQDTLGQALPLLRGEPGVRLGPPPGARPRKPLGLALRLAMAACTFLLLGATAAWTRASDSPLWPHVCPVLGAVGGLAASLLLDGAYLRASRRGLIKLSAHVALVVAGAGLAAVIAPPDDSPRVSLIAAAALTGALSGGLLGYLRATRGEDAF